MNEADHLPGKETRVTIDLCDLAVMAPVEDDASMRADIWTVHGISPKEIHIHECLILSIFVVVGTLRTALDPEKLCAKRAITSDEHPKRGK